MVRRNTDTIHLLDRWPKQKKVLKQANGQIIWESYLRCARKSTLFANCAEDAHCSRELFNQSGICPIIPEEKNAIFDGYCSKSVSDFEQHLGGNWIGHASVLTWSSQHEGGQCVAEPQTSQGLEWHQAPCWRGSFVALLFDKSKETNLRSCFKRTIQGWFSHISTFHHSILSMETFLPHPASSRRKVDVEF